MMQPQVSELDLLREKHDRTKEALRKSQSNYRLVVDNLKDIVFQTDATGLWTFLNPAWEEVTGFKVEESLGNLFLNYVWPEDRELNQQRFLPLIERKKDYCRHHIRYTTKDGSPCWMEVYARLTLDEGDNIIGTSGTITDINERKTLELELETYRNRLEDLVLERTSQLYKLKEELEQRVALRTEELVEANKSIVSLNKRLEAENLRMSAELTVTRRLQQLILPAPEELSNIRELDISGLMIPADEVGGDYYDVYQNNGLVGIGIGDVTGHGLESGVLMLMVQTAIRTLLTYGEHDLTRFMNVINRTIYHNVQRMKTDKSLSLIVCILHNGVLRVVGQHEHVIIVREGGKVELIDTVDLGMPIGLEEDISSFVREVAVTLHPGDGVVLYTDGVTEAQDGSGDQYGVERLCGVVGRCWNSSSEKTREALLEDIYRHVGQGKMYDDLAVVVLKRMRDAQAASGEIDG